MCLARLSCCFPGCLMFSGVDFGLLVFERPQRPTARKAPIYPRWIELVGDKASRCLDNNNTSRLGHATHIGILYRNPM